MPFTSGLEIELPITERPSMWWKQIKQNTFDKKRGNKRQIKKYDLFLNTNICTMLDHVSSWLSFSLSVVSIFCTRFSLLYFSSFVTSQLTPFRPSALRGVFDMHYHKILKISPGTYIFQRPFLRGLFFEFQNRPGLYLEGNLQHVYAGFYCIWTISLSPHGRFQMPYRTLCSSLFPNIDTCINKGDWRFQL